MSNVLWQVELVGDQEDLLALSRSFTHSDCRIESVKGKFYLTSSRFDADPRSYGPTPSQEPGALDMRPPQAADDVRRSAIDTVALINGAAYLEFVPYKAVRLGSVYGYYEGEGVPFVTVHYSAGGSRLVWTRDFPSESSAPVRWLQCAQTDSDVAEALDLFGLQPESERERRRNLYSILEIIREDVGGDKAIAARGWASINEVGRCGRSLNLARHARPTGTPPAKPMRISEAESLIRRLMKSWITDRSQSSFV